MAEAMVGQRRGRRTRTPAAVAITRLATTRYSGEPLVAICMATHNPPPELLDRQLDSIREQTHDNWVCVISDDCSRRSALAAIWRAVGGDERFVVSRSPRRLGFYRNFERALSWCPRRPPLSPSPIRTTAGTRTSSRRCSRARRRPARLQRRARGRRDGALISDTWWTDRAQQPRRPALAPGRKRRHRRGVAVAPRAARLRAAVPAGAFAHFHDHWLARGRRSLGEIAFVDRPLYDYVQHGQASLGHAAANRMLSLRDRSGTVRRCAIGSGMWRLHYFVDVCRLRQFATVLASLRRTHDPGQAPRAAALSGAERSSVAVDEAGAAAAPRELLELRPETLGRRWMLLHALALAAPAGSERPRPPAVPLSPRCAAASDLDPAARPVGPRRRRRAIATRSRRCGWPSPSDAPRRINVLIPTIDPDALLRRLHRQVQPRPSAPQRGGRVRIVTVDPSGRCPLTGARRSSPIAG